ncbi:MAG TPA: UbiA family prenyltransferase [Gemmatimonadales bacterium]|nr:UbiA family prenyltransferase [Gemmatimonadales bacterium]
MVTDAHATKTLNVWRRAGYGALPGDAFSYILHMRPAEWPIMAAHTVLGYVLAVGWSGLRSGQQLGSALFALFIWVICLNGGTLAINSVYDKDEGDVGYLNSPPPLPKHLLTFSWVLLVLGQVLAFRLPWGFRIAYAVCFVMSVAYSVPPLRFKAVAGLDWVINMWGFGTLTPYAAWAATGRPLDLGHAVIFLSFCALFAGLYPLTQLYQLEEDKKRGDRTLALMFGLEASLWLATGSVILAFGGLSWAADILRRSGTLIFFALAAWLAVLVPWIRARNVWTPQQHQRGMYWALGAWAVTDVAVLLVFAR